MLIGIGLGMPPLVMADLFCKEFWQFFDSAAAVSLTMTVVDICLIAAYAWWHTGGAFMLPIMLAFGVTNGAGCAHMRHGVGQITGGAQRGESFTLHPPMATCS
jgi:hypothetical protein